MQSKRVKKNGGGGRTRTCEGIASGFTVRPLCRSGHSPEGHCTALISKDNRLRRPVGICRFYAEVFQRSQWSHRSKDAGSHRSPASGYERFKNGKGRTVQSPRPFSALPLFKSSRHCHKNNLLEQSRRTSATGGHPRRWPPTWAAFNGAALFFRNARQALRKYRHSQREWPGRCSRRAPGNPNANCYIKDAGV